MGNRERTDDLPSEDGMSERPILTRRRFCGTAAAVSLSLLSSPATAGSTGGRVVFIYDDSPEEDYTETYPVHRDEGVPGCIAAVSDRIGHGSWLKPKQLREMEGNGWEIMSHSVRHRALGAIDVTQDIEPGDTKIYVESNFHDRVSGDEILVSDGEKTETFTVNGGEEDATGEYLVAEKPLQTGFTAADGVTERYTDELLRHSLSKSKETLEGFGVDISTIVLPFGRTQGRVQELIPEYYDVLANQHHGGFNPKGSLDPYHLGRTVFRNGKGGLTTEEIGQFLDRVRDENALGIFVGHTREEGLTPDRVRETIRMTKQRNLEITTLNQALSDFDVLDETPTTTTTTSTTTATETTSASTTTTAGSSGTKGQTATTTSPQSSGTKSDWSPSMDHLGIVSLLGVVGAGVLTYVRRGD